MALNMLIWRFYIMSSSVIMLSSSDSSTIDDSLCLLAVMRLRFEIPVTAPSCDSRSVVFRDFLEVTSTDCINGEVASTLAVILPYSRRDKLVFILDRFSVVLMPGKPLTAEFLVVKGDFLRIGKRGPMSVLRA